MFAAARCCCKLQTMSVVTDRPPRASLQSHHATWMLEKIVSAIAMMPGHAKLGHMIGTMKLENKSNLFRQCQRVSASWHLAWYGQRGRLHFESALQTQNEPPPVACTKLDHLCTNRMGC